MSGQPAGLSTLDLLDLLVLRSKISDLKSEHARLQRIQTGHVAANHFGLAVGTSDLIRQTLEAAVQTQTIFETLSTQGEEQHGNEV